MYGYVNNDSTNYLDINGQNSLLIGCLVGAASQGITGWIIDINDKNPCSKGTKKSSSEIASNLLLNALGGCAFGVFTVFGAGNYGVVGTLASSIGGLGIDAGLNSISLFGG